MILDDLISPESSFSTGMVSDTIVCPILNAVVAKELNISGELLRRYYDDPRLRPRIGANSF
jgi:hypothetical protein